MMHTPNLTNALDFSGKVSLITGGSRGIGAGIARRFAEAGGSVVVSYVKGEQAAQEVVAQIRAANGLAQAIQADVTLAHDVDRMISQTLWNSTDGLMCWSITPAPIRFQHSWK